MRRRFDFYDFVLWSLALLCLVLTAPVLPRWVQLNPERKLPVALVFLLGVTTVWVATHRPAFLKDNATETTDPFDFAMVAAGWCFGTAACRNAFRWSQTGGLTIHHTLIVAVLGTLAIFAFYCIVERGGLKKLANIFLLLAGLAFVQGLWQLTTGSESSMNFYVSSTKQAACGWMAIGFTFAGVSLLAFAMKRRREKDQ